MRPLTLTELLPPWVAFPGAPSLQFSWIRNFSVSSFLGMLSRFYFLMLDVAPSRSSSSESSPSTLSLDLFSGWTPLFSSSICSIIAALVNALWRLSSACLRSLTLRLLRAYSFLILSFSLSSSCFFFSSSAFLLSLLFFATEAGPPAN